MRTKVKMIGIGLLLTVSTFAKAQDTTATKSGVLTLTLDQAVELALNDNPTVKIADQEIKRVEYVKKGSRYNFIPTVSGTASYTQILQQESMMFGQKMPSTQDMQASLGLSASLPLLVPAMFRTAQMSNLEMDMAIEKARSSKIDMKSSTKQAFYTVLLAEAAYIAIKEGYEIAKENYENSKQKFELGAAAEYDAISNEVQMRNLLPSLVQAETGIKQAKLYLKVLLSIGMDTDIQLVGKLTDYENDVTLIKGQTDLSQNSTLIQLNIQKDQLHKQLQLQRTTRMPSLVAFANYNYNANGAYSEKEMSFLGQKMIIPAEIYWTPSFVVGAQLSVPIFSGLTQVTKENQIKVSQNMLDLQSDYTKHNLNLQLESINNNMKEAIEQMESNKEGIKLAEKGYEISKGRYNSGMGTSLELRTASLALTQSKLAYSQAIFNYLEAKSEQDAVLGVE